MKKLTLSLALLASLASGAANALVIDTFNDVQNLNNANGTGTFGPASSALTPAFSDFTTRSFALDVTSNVNSQTVALDSNLGRLSASKGPNTFSDWNVVWNKTGAPLDFTLGGDNKIEYTVLENNAPFVDLMFSVMDAANISATYTVANVPFILSGSPQSYSFLYSNFTGGAVDFTQIKQFAIAINGTDAGNGVDLQLDFVGTTHDTVVPEIDAISGTGALTLMAGALALAGERRRRRS